jgi:hypothetical protein
MWTSGSYYALPPGAETSSEAGCHMAWSMQCGRRGNTRKLSLRLFVKDAQRAHNRESPACQARAIWTDRVI